MPDSENGLTDRLRITGLTGVDIELDIAGAGSRSYAFIIDWHIRFLLAVVVFLVATQLVGSSGGSGWRRLLQLTTIPALAVYFLYHPVLEIASGGRTPGKRTAGIRIVTLQGGTPSVGAHLLRNVFRLIDSLPSLYVVGLLCCLFTQRRVRIGDLAAGTLLVHERAAPAKSLRELGDIVSQTGLSPQLAEVVDDLLQRWPELDSLARQGLARTVLARVDGNTPKALSLLSDGELRRRLQEALR